jgi:hypothetical protein
VRRQEVLSDLRRQTTDTRLARDVDSLARAPRSRAIARRTTRRNDTPDFVTTISSTLM